MIQGILGKSISKHTIIYVTRVSAHQKDHSNEAVFNNAADKLTRELPPNQ